MEGGGYTRGEGGEKDRALEEAAKDPRKLRPRAEVTSWTWKKKKRNGGMLKSSPALDGFHSILKMKRREVGGWCWEGAGG